MKKKELNYQEIELLLFILSEPSILVSLGDSQSAQKKTNELYMKLISMRAQMEYFKLRESETK